jgi:capsular polysaccharide biosynthesis protein
MPDEKQVEAEARAARRAERRQQMDEERVAELEEARAARRAERLQKKAEARAAVVEKIRAAHRAERLRKKAEARAAVVAEVRAAHRAERLQKKAEERSAVVEKIRAAHRAQRLQKKAEERAAKVEEARAERQRKAERKLLEANQRRQEADRLRWRWSDGRLTFFNLKRESQKLPVVEVQPLEAKEIETALISRLRNPALPPGAFSGAVYDRDGHIMPEFLEHDALTQHRVNRSINAPILERARMEEADRIYDTCVYLGRWSGFFGDFLLESLARAWYLSKVDRSTPLLFQQWDDRLNIPPFAFAFLKALNVQPTRIRIVAGRDLRVRTLFLPSRQFWQGAKASPGMCTVFDQMRERMLLSRSSKGRTPEKVYLSRRGLGGVRASGPTRSVIVNEEEAEILFRNAGYEIVQPELLPVEEQVAIVANATHVAGPSGSALHLMLFNANPQARLIELRTKLSVNQLLISAIRDSQSFHIWCRRRGEPADTTTLEMDIVERAMREIG